jgi:hypothetical protein
VTTRRLAVFLIATFVGAQALVLIALRGRYEDSGLLPIAWFAEGRQGRDSWDPMAQAYLHATTPHRLDRAFYWRTAFSPQVLRKGFQYPPTALLVVSALDGVLGPRWPDLVDEETFDIASPDYCVLGQAYAGKEPTEEQLDALTHAGVTLGRVGPRAPAARPRSRAGAIAGRPRNRAHRRFCRRACPVHTRSGSVAFIRTWGAATRIGDSTTSR